MCGFCDVFHSVSSPVAATHCAIADRGSIGFAIRRWRLIVSLTVTSASAKAASVSPPASGQVKAMLLSTSS